MCRVRTAPKPSGAALPLKGTHMRPIFDCDGANHRAVTNVAFRRTLQVSRISLFSAPFLLGFDTFEERVDRLSKAADGYPPYNIERRIDADGSEQYVISIAVAGFAQHELEISTEDNQLVVRGRQKDDPSREFLHRGIAARQFQRSFLLADGVVVKDALLRNGMLIVSVVRPKAEKVARRIEIRSA
jgi:HSP20 family molecular chaperone IbpA